MLRAGLVEKIGSGVNRIRDLVSNVNFEISSNWFAVEFPRDEVGRGLGETAGINAGIKLTKFQESLIAYITQNEGVNATNMSKLFEKDIRSIE